ncbi:hypothetical protein EXU57_21975 [Segetibacter sp. 3557_3]|uniref:transmembrane 220 family protein n=1 Tax=Segetibacter sp. 3557_3 TaxID=2547429 RepID=UPI001058A6EB|nr:transmembrane 220 family protein [Segetibacter sp. 3557_3]TDH19950.1 hypothetical protein EXU57_21975 [Segetibacter sp. 3557_3]
MKAVNIFFIIIFVLSAALQYNDPDPYIWMPLYLYGGLLCYWAYQKKYKPVLYYIGFAVYIPYALYLFFDKTGVLNWAEEHQAENIAQSMKATKPWIEETREFFGLLILIFALTINMVWLRKLKRVVP